MGGASGAWREQMIRCYVYIDCLAVSVPFREQGHYRWGIRLQSCPHHLGVVCLTGDVAVC